MARNRKNMRSVLILAGVAGVGIGLFLLLRKPKPKQAVTASSWVDKNLFGGGQWKTPIADQRLSTVKSLFD